MNKSWGDFRKYLPRGNGLMLLKWKPNGGDESSRSPGASARQRGRSREPGRHFGLFLGEFCD